RTIPLRPASATLVHSIFPDSSRPRIVTVGSALLFSVRTPSLKNGTAIDNGFAMPFHSSRDNNRGAAYATADLRFTKAFALSRDRRVKLHVIAEGTNIFNHTNFDKVSDQFDIGGITTAAKLANGQTLNLLTG